MKATQLTMVCEAGGAASRAQIPLECGSHAAAFSSDRDGGGLPWAKAQAWLAHSKVWASLAVAIALLAGGPARAASETVSNKFDFYVPVALSVIEISGAVGVIPSPFVAFAAKQCTTIACAIQEGTR